VAIHAIAADDLPVDGSTVPAGTVLPSTGKSSAAIAWIATLALAVGLLIVRAARRPRAVR